MFTSSQLVITALACISSTLWIARPVGEVAVPPPYFGHLAGEVTSAGCVCQPSGLTFAAFGAAFGLAGLVLGWGAHSQAVLIASSYRHSARAAPTVSPAGVGRLQGY